MSHQKREARACKRAEIEIHRALEGLASIARQNRTAWIEAYQEDRDRLFSDVLDVLSSLSAARDYLSEAAPGLSVLVDAEFALNAKDRAAAAERVNQ